MKAAVVFESMFGNTQKVAEAIGRGLSSAFETAVIEVGHAPDGLADGVDLLVVGGPTHAFGMSRPSTRKSAVEQRGQRGWTPVSSSDGVREWLDALSKAKGVKAAAFDTRVPRKGFLSFGSAARGIASELNKRGFKLVADPEGFLVLGTEGPLAERELERAEEWGRAIASSATAAQATAA